MLCSTGPIWPKAKIVKKKPGSGGMLAVKGEVTAVSKPDEYQSCTNCKGSKVVELIVECRKCGMKMKLRKSMVAQLVIEDEKEEKHRVTAFRDIVETIVRGQLGRAHVLSSSDAVHDYEK